MRWGSSIGLTGVVDVRLARIDHTRCEEDEDEEEVVKAMLALCNNCFFWIFPTMISRVFGVCYLFQKEKGVNNSSGITHRISEPDTVGVLDRLALGEWVWTAFEELLHLESEVLITTNYYWESYLPGLGYRLNNLIDRLCSVLYGSQNRAYCRTWFLVIVIVLAGKVMMATPRQL